MLNSPRYLRIAVAVVVVSLFAVASSQSVEMESSSDQWSALMDSSDQLDWSVLDDLPWTCVPVEGTATQGMCAGTTIEGGSWCTMGLDQQMKDTLPKEMLEQSQKAQKDMVRSTRISIFNCIMRMRARCESMCCVLAWYCVQTLFEREIHTR